MPVSDDQLNAAKSGLTGFTLGAIFGAVMGVLYAPREGAKTRQLIREQAESTTDRAKVAVSDVQQAVDEKTTALSNKVKMLKGELEENLSKDKEEQKAIAELEKRVEELEAMVAKSKK